MKVIIVIDDISDDIEITKLRARVDIDYDGDIIAIYRNQNLKLLPERKEEDFFEYWRKRGFNECLDLIDGDSED